MSHSGKFSNLKDNREPEIWTQLVRSAEGPELQRALNYRGLFWSKPGHSDGGL